jgi:phosphoribosylformimino-5-aminoimidazole carboxamide ribotide isomerase
LELWAAIDLLSGSVVTLRQGRESERTTWGASPAEAAARWEREGASGLHIVDLDAAFGKGSNRKTIEGIIGRSGIPVQVGGGVRTPEIAKGLLDVGARRVVLGTIAYTYPKVLVSLLQEYGPERIVVAADYRDGMVVTKGWTANQGLRVMEASKKFELLGVTNLLATAVAQDGMAAGPDLQTVERLCASTKMNVLASGGIRNGEDLAQLERRGAAGAILGRALYEGGVRLGGAR